MFVYRCLPGYSPVIVSESSANSPAAPADTTADASFQDLGLSETMLAALAQAEYLQPTPIQAGLIPACLGRRRRAGPGPHRHRQDGRLRDPDPGTARAASARARAAGPGAGAHARVGRAGARRSGQAGPRPQACTSWPSTAASRSAGRSKSCSAGADVVVGTPGRVLDHMGRGTLDLDDLAIVVLDEADRMLDIGFRPDIEKILRRCPQSRQTLLLERHGAAAGRAAGPAATCAIRSRSIFRPATSSVETIEQFYFTVDPERKFELLDKLLEARGAAAGDHLLPHQARHRQGAARGWPSGSRTSPASTAICRRTPATA